MAESVSADPNRLEAHQKSPYRHLWWLAVFAIIGCFIYFSKNDEVFAAASLNLKMPKEQVIEKACQWAVKLGYNPAPGQVAVEQRLKKGEESSDDSPPKSPTRTEETLSKKNDKKPAVASEALKSITFSYDDDAKSFLEYELGVRKANELMAQEIPIWYWRVRLCRELEQEELKVWINPEGKLAGVDHDFENEKELPSLTHEEAEKVARNFVEKEVGTSLEGFNLIKDESNQKPKRKDHSFTFEDTKQDYKGGKLRVYVGLAGDQISAYNRYLHVPEVFDRKFQNIRSYNQMLGKIAQIFMTLLGLISVFAFGWAVMTGNIRWRPVIVISLIYSVFPFLDNVNNFNELIDSYDTTVSFSSYVSKTLVGLVASILPQVLSAVVLFGAAEALYRRAFPDHTAIEKIFTKEGLRSKAVALALLVGQLLFLIDLGWVVFYYLMGQRVGFWCPLGVENYEILSSFAPAISAMRVGISASFMEEALYRVVGMALMMRISGNFWVANFFQATAWGFAHSFYPQQPFYARGVELTLGGLLDGWILRRYGILACVSSHYLFDTFLGVKPLFTSGESSLKATAYLSVLPFLVLLVYSATRTKSLKVVEGAESDEQLLNRSVSSTIQERELDEVEPDETPISYKPIPAQKRLFLFTLTVILGFASFLMHPQILNEDVKVHIERHQAEAKAAEILTRHGIEAPGYSVVSYLSEQTAGQSEQYIYEKNGFAKTDSVVRNSHSGGFCWRVRFFKAKVPEEYEVQLDGDGREIGTDITLAEETKGAILTKDEAYAKARNEIDATYPYLKPYELESASEQKRPARTDWTFIFRSKQFDVAESQFKIRMSVLGNLVTGANWSWEVPDKWSFERSKKSMREELGGYIVMGGYFVALIFFAVWVIGILHARAIRVRPALIIGFVYSLTLLPSQLNALPMLFLNYNTTNPVSNFLTDKVSSYVQSYIGAFFMSAIIAGFAIACMRILFPTVRLSNFFQAVLRPHNRENQSVQRVMWVDGALAGYAYVSLLEFIFQCSVMAKTHFSPDIQQAGLSVVSSLLNLQFPPLDPLIGGPVEGVREILTVCIAAGVYARFCRNPGIYFALVFLVTLGHCIGTRNPQDAVINFVSAITVATLNWFFVVKIGRTNPVAYFTAGVGILLFSRIMTMISHGLPVLLPTIAVSALVLAGPAIVAAVLSLRSDLPVLPAVDANPSPPVSQTASDASSDSDATDKMLAEEQSNELPPQ